MNLTDKQKNQLIGWLWCQSYVVKAECLEKDLACSAIELAEHLPKFLDKLLSGHYQEDEKLETFAENLLTQP